MLRFKVDPVDESNRVKLQNYNLQAPLLSIEPGFKFETKLFGVRANNNSSLE
jgi:hypothetical protein